ncbi:hypothetical protein [Smaragdicoccus niigatensis]|uniref:hypothetical protein n=1 Tax=Smaragdicoccus niigatensis TaxID=359359 RepID=UPI00037175FA|nr:hypothetical protein [Smaragdicoccus niigatensis]
MYSGPVDMWQTRPRAVARGITIAYCIIVALPLGLMLVFGAFWLLSFRPMNWVFYIGALVCALVGPALVLLLLPAIQAVSNERLVVDRFDFGVVNAQRLKVRSISLDSISGVWMAQLPPRRAASDVPTFPRRAYVVTGTAGERPVLLTREYSAKDLTALWQLLGREPVDIGRTTEKELEVRFPGARYTAKDMVVDLGHWAAVYVVLEIVMLIYIVFTGIRLAL